MVMHRQWGGSPCGNKRVFLTSLEASGAGGPQTLSVPASQRAGLGGSDLFCRGSSALRCRVNADGQEWMDARLRSSETVCRTENSRWADGPGAAVSGPWARASTAGKTFLGLAGCVCWRWGRSLAPSQLARRLPPRPSVQEGSRWLNKGRSLLFRAEDISREPAAAILDGAASEAGKGLMGHLLGWRRTRAKGWAGRGAAPPASASLGLPGLGPLHAAPSGSRACADSPPGSPGSRCDGPGADGHLSVRTGTWTPQQTSLCFSRRNGNVGHEQSCAGCPSRHAWSALLSRSREGPASSASTGGIRAAAKA